MNLHKHIAQTFKTHGVPLNLYLTRMKHMKSTGISQCALCLKTKKKTSMASIITWKLLMVTKNPMSRILIPVNYVQKVGTDYLLKTTIQCHMNLDTYLDYGINIPIIPKGRLFLFLKDGIMM